MGDKDLQEKLNEHIKDAQAMADKIEHNWDKFVELTLEEEAIAH